MIDARCSSISSVRVEDLRATASIVRSWVLIEQPGPWGSEALVQSDLPTELGEALTELGRRHRARVLLLRRPDRPDRSSAEGRHCFVAHSGRPRMWIEHRLVTDPSELLTIDFARLQSGQPVGFGTPYTDPLFLVCTNGRHDPCCAQLGRPVARALVGHHARAVWECSHVGGDRFAGNLVCFPHGLYYGRIDPSVAEDVVHAYERGEIDLDHYRGRAGDPFVVQAAESLLRAETGLLGVDDLEPAWRRKVNDDGVVDVGFEAKDGRHFDVRVAVNGAAEARPLTCAAVHQEHPPAYSLVSVQAS